MAIDLIEQIRNQLGYKPLPKIDPNTQEPANGQTVAPDIGNAAIPAVLAGFYKRTRSEEAADKIIHTDNNDILQELFCEQKDQVTDSVAAYSRVSPEAAKDEMQRVASAVRQVVQDNVKDEKGAAVMAFFTAQRSNILKHLPVELHMGELINDPAMDDRTNKMEGPMSGMMHTIEKIFSSSK
jgi:hypothetical protein